MLPPVAGLEGEAECCTLSSLNMALIHSKHSKVLIIKMGYSTIFTARAALLL